MSKKTTEFGCLCRQYRIALRITIIQAAEIIGVNQSDISKIENGEQSPSFDYIKKSIDLYQIKDRNKQMEFFLSNLNSSKKIEIPMKGLGPVCKEWLAVLCTFGEVYPGNTDGWNELLKYMKELPFRLEKLKAPFNQFEKITTI